VVLLARRRHRRQIVPEEEFVIDVVEDLAAILERLVDASGDVARQVPDGKKEAAVRLGIGFQPANGTVEVVEAKLLFRGQGSILRECVFPSGLLVRERDHPASAGKDAIEGPVVRNP